MNIFRIFLPGTHVWLGLIIDGKTFFNLVARALEIILTSVLSKMIGLQYFKSFRSCFLRTIRITPLFWENESSLSLEYSLTNW